MFLQDPLAPNSISLLLAALASSSMAKKLILALIFLDFFRVFAGASGAKLDVSGLALRRALSVFLQVLLVPNSILFAGTSGAKLDA